MTKEYTLTIYGENRVGLTNRVCAILTQRGINIENFTAAETEIKNVYKFTVVVLGEKNILEKVVLQIEKLIEIHRAFVHEEEEVLYQEMALFKVSTKRLANDSAFEHFLRTNDVRLLSITPEYFVLEKTGHSKAILKILDYLEPYGVIEFSRSGRVAIIKWSRHFHDHLKALSQKPESAFD